MNTPPKSRKTSNLEPDDWGQFRSLGKKMVEDMTDFLADIRERPVWQPVSTKAKSKLSQSIPMQPTNAEAVYAEFCEYILPYPRGNIHPRFWGWVNGSGVPISAYADFLASVMNGTVSSSESAAMLVEEQVICWLKEAFDWPTSGNGLLTSGCSTGQIIGIAASRVAKAKWDIRKEGVFGGPQLTVYCSEETHLSVQKAVELLGLGSNNLRKISVNEDFTINVGDLEAQIRKDRSLGCLPICIVGNVGTVNTGAIDSLDDLLRVARQEDVWLHLDGAFGAFAYLLPTHKRLLASLKEADSLVFDLHKWLYMPFDVSCILVKDPDILASTFCVDSNYTSKTVGGPGAYSISFSDMGIEQSRPFRALKVWFALKTYGLSVFAENITANIDQIAYLNARIDESPLLERISRSRLNVVCFRYRHEGTSDDILNTVNQQILNHIQTEGIAVPSHTIIRGKFLIRVANNNHRTDFTDFDYLIEEVLKRGNLLVQSGG